MCLILQDGFWFVHIITKLLWEFFILKLAKSSTGSKSPQVSRTLLSILAELNNAIVWMVFNFYVVGPFNNPFGDHSKCTHYNWYHCRLHFP